MNDSHIFINPRTPGYKLVTVEHRSPQIDSIFDKGYSSEGGHESFIPFITVSETDAKTITCEMRIDVDGEDIVYRAAENPQLDGTGFASIRLEENYE